MKGLELNESRYSTVLLNKDHRIDSQFYTKQPIKSPLLLYEQIGKHLLSSQYGISISMNEESIGNPIYRMNEIHDMLCDTEVAKCADITPEEYAFFALNNRDVLFNRTNSFEWVGRTGIYYQNDSIKRTFASYLVRLVPDENVILPEYLTTYLNSKYGSWDIKRRARQSINQTNVNPEEVKEMEIPILDMSCQMKIKSAIEQANKLRLLAESFYRDAEKHLLEELGIADWQPSKESTAIGTFALAHALKRWDAEYYQPKYESCKNVIERYDRGYDSISHICQIIDIKYQPLNGVIYKYIELANIGKKGEITGYTQGSGEDLPSRARRLVRTGDVIVSSVEGSLQSCAIIPEELDGALCSTGFYVIRSSFYTPESLLVLFKSNPIQMLLKKGCSGSILSAIGKTELEKITLPLIDKTTQIIISQQVQQSFELRAESKRLLEVAKRTVEIAIEENEEKAIQYINEYGKSLYDK